MFVVDLLTTFVVDLLTTFVVDLLTMARRVWRWQPIQGPDLAARLRKARPARSNAIPANHG